MSHGNDLSVQQSKTLGINGQYLGALQTNVGDWLPNCHPTGHDPKDYRDWQRMGVYRYQRQSGDLIASGKYRA